MLQWPFNKLHIEALNSNYVEFPGTANSIANIFIIKTHPPGENNITLYAADNVIGVRAANPSYCAFTIKLIRKANNRNHITKEYIDHVNAPDMKFPWRI